VSPLPVATCAGVNQHVLNAGIVDHDRVTVQGKVFHYRADEHQDCTRRSVRLGLSEHGIIVQRKIDPGGGCDSR
jgi:hypothetical protein